MNKNQNETSRVDVLGVGFDDTTKDVAVARAFRWITGRTGGFVVTPNPEIVWMCRKDADLRKAVADARLVLADGVGVVLGARILKRPLAEKIPGIDFASALFSKMAEAGQSVFLLGAKPGVAEQAGARLCEAYPGLVVAGTAHGYFQEDGPIVARINQARPDLLLVCLGAPRQELWMHRHSGDLDVGLMAGLGGALDVFAGTAERAPAGWQKAGLEWLYRLIKEPRRVKRMRVLPLFLLAVIFRRLRGEPA